MTKKELSKYYYLSREIKDLEERIQTLQNQSVGVSKLTGMPFSNEKSNPVEKRAELLITLKNKLEKRKTKSLEELIKIEKCISAIEDIETRMIMTKRYIELKSWEKISMEMYMSERTLFRKQKAYFKEANNERTI
ncbi:MAG: DUF1492 domain-containing protein [Bacilli bacterium]|nr:DUF1492 domain-containing protein [Bacilli bacterium]MBQ2938518.1 DUF1492 domain-containing protein [Clostridia bacterium]MBQ6687421.1 DUF1492 domain-containing protein [Bacilli bacterium]